MKLGFAIAVLGGLLAGCNGSQSERGTAGYIEGDLVLVGPEDGGRIAVLSVAEGDTVLAGTRLFKLESAIQEADVAAARAKLNEAQTAMELSRKSLERAQALREQGVAAQSRLDDATAAFERDKAAVATAKAGLDQANTRLAKRNVPSPASGAIQDVYFRAGEVVNAGQPVLALLPPGNLRVRFYVAEPRRAELKLGQTVEVTCDSCPNGLTAAVSFISKEAEFTPPVIFSREERRKLVYLVEAIPQGDTTKLTVGQPVTVTLPPKVAGAAQ